MALAGIAIGLVIGAIAPIVANPYLATVLPVDQSIRLFPRALALAAGFGLLTTVTFSILPLGIARGVSAVTLFREGNNDTGRWPSWRSLLALALSLCLLAGLAIYTADDRRVAMNVLVAIAIGFVGLRLVGSGVAAIARHAPRFRSPSLRLAIGNIHRPGALTGPVGALAWPRSGASRQPVADRRQPAPAVDRHGLPPRHRTSSSSTSRRTRSSPSAPRSTSWRRDRRSMPRPCCAAASR